MRDSNTIKHVLMNIEMEEGHLERLLRLRMKCIPTHPFDVRRIGEVDGLTNDAVERKHWRYKT